MGSVYGYLKYIDGVDITVQRDALLGLGCEIFVEEDNRPFPGRRPVFLSLVDSLVQGDTLAVYDVSFVFNSLPDFFNILSSLCSKGVTFLSFNDPWINTECPDGIPFCDVVSKISLLNDRINRVLNSLHMKRNKGGRRPKSKADIELAVKMYNSGDFTIEQICKAMKISKATLYRYIEPNKR